MSSNKRLRSESDSLKRQSFDERICDDLSEVILQFLPLKDKKRLECVSKQFQRTVFVKQRVIGSDDNIFNTKRFEPKQKFIDKRLKIFELIVKKCQNINKIEEMDWFYTKTKYNLFIDIIITNCNNLTHFDINFDLISKVNQKRFLEKFGSNITRSKALFYDLSRSTFKSFNVEELTIYCPFPSKYDLVFNRLDRLKICGLREKFLDQLEVFVDRNKTLIKQLILEDFRFEDNNKCKQLLNIISKLTNLVHLTFDNLGTFKLNDKLFVNNWKQIAVNCSQLKSLEFDVMIDPNDGPINDILLSSFKQFKSLKRLFIIWDNFDDPLLEDYIKSFSFKAFKGFEGLTHLAIVLPEKWSTDNPEIDETILTDIDINLPNLQFLRLDSDKINATELTADILSRLLKLKTIEFCVKESVQPLIENKLINCNKIENISFNRNEWRDLESNKW